jgi:tol-pal system protein YbgF
VIRSVVVAALAVSVVSCTGVDGDGSRPAVVPQAPVVVTDPRVSELQALTSELLDRIEVLNSRIHLLEAGQPQQQVREVRTTAAAPRTAPAVTAATEGAAGSQPPAARTPQPSRVVIPAGTALSQAYQNGLELFGRGRIDDSRRVFESVFEANPESDLADNALFWIGETYYVTGKLSEAMSYFRRVASDYPDQNKAPDAMLRLGLAISKTGDLALARSTFDQLIARYPYSTAASAAKYEIKRIQY